MVEWWRRERSEGEWRLGEKGKDGRRTNRAKSGQVRPSQVKSGRRPREEGERVNGCGEAPRGRRVAGRQEAGHGRGRWRWTSDAREAG